MMTKEILFDYFSGRAAPLIKNRVEEWLRQPGSEEFFYECLEAWENTYLQDIPPLDEEHHRYREYMRRTPATALPPAEASTPELPKRWPFSGWLAVAASVVLLLGASFVFWKDTILYRTYTARYGETCAVTLPDRSQVTLSANSTLRVPRRFGKDEIREVWLSGEAFFSVTHQRNHRRFVVHAKQMDIEVLGTKFNVNDRRGATQVVLQEGQVKIVSFLESKADTVLMKPGQLAKASHQRKQVTLKKVQAESYVSWRENKLVFEETPLPEVLQTVEDYYGITFTNRSRNAAWLQKRYTGILPNNDLPVVLKALSSIYRLDIQREENQIIIQ